MSIQVTCPGCLKRFTVADAHAGKEGPCPSCKKPITIPKLDEQVVIHEAPPEGPVDSKGRSVLKTSRKSDAKFQPKVLGAAVGGIVLAIVAAYLLKGTGPLVLLVGAAVIGPLVVRGGYLFLRDDELEPYSGSALWMRSAGCGLVFAATWFLYSFLLNQLAVPEDIAKGVAAWQLIVSVVGMFVVGILAGLVALDLDPTNAGLLFTLFFISTGLLRLVMGLSFVPGLLLG